MIVVLRIIDVDSLRVGTYMGYLEGQELTNLRKLNNDTLQSSKNAALKEELIPTLKGEWPDRIAGLNHLPDQYSYSESQVITFWYD